MAPAKAARISVHEETAPNFPSNRIITIATHIFAPAEMPSTKGPAIGFPKNVCRRKPESERPPPSTAARRILGMRIFQIMLTSFASPCRVSRILRILSAGIWTLPVLILSITTAANAAAKIAKTAVYRSRRTVFTCLFCISHSPVF